LMISGLILPSFLLAKTKLVTGETLAAEHLLRGCVDKNSDNAEAYLLLAQVLNRQSGTLIELTSFRFMCKRVSWTRPQSCWILALALTFEFGSIHFSF
jgi:hypothetical protein